MNNSSIKQINTAGLVGYIVCILLIILTITGMVATAIGVAAGAAVSREQVSVSVSSNIDINTSSADGLFSKLNSFMGIDGVKNLNDLITEDGMTVSVNDNDIKDVTVSKSENGYLVNLKTNSVNFTAARLIAALVVTFLFLGALTVMFYMLKGLMKALWKCETPFAEDVIKWMSRFAVSMFPAVVLGMLTSGFWSYASGGTNFSMTINLGSVLAVAVIYLLIIVFKYGAKLQKESDETL